MSRPADCPAPPSADAPSDGFEGEDLAPDANEEAEPPDFESGAILDLPAEEDAVARGVAAIRKHWQHAPLGPGVYRMIGADGEVLYVGKAKSVRKRIASYLRGEGHTNRLGA